MLLEVQEVSVSLSLFSLCVFYSFKSIYVKLLLSLVSFVDRPGREGGSKSEGGNWWREGWRWREGG